MAVPSVPELTPWVCSVPRYLRVILFHARFVRFGEFRSVRLSQAVFLPRQLSQVRIWFSNCQSNSKFPVIFCPTRPDIRIEQFQLTSPSESVWFNQVRACHVQYNVIFKIRLCSVPDPCRIRVFRQSRRIRLSAV